MIFVITVVKMLWTHKVYFSLSPFVVPVHTDDDLAECFSQESNPLTFVLIVYRRKEKRYVVKFNHENIPVIYLNDEMIF